MFIIFLHIFFWLLAFTQGLFHIFQWPTAIYKVGLPTIIIILFMFLIIKKRISNLKFPYIGYFILLLLVTLLSKFNNVTDNFSYVYFLIYLSINYLYFIIIVNDRNIAKNRKIFIIIIFLYILQIPATILKFFVIGQTESFIGTLSYSSGSLGTIVPLFAITFLISLYFFKPQKRYLLLSLGFFLISIITGKRAIAIYFPLMFIIIFLIYNIKLGNLFSRKTIHSFVIIILGSSVFFYFSIRLNPTLNPENRIGGRFDIKYFTDYTEHYVSSYDKSVSEMRRIEGIQYFTKYLYSKELLTFLFGEGSGRLIQSKYNIQSGSLLDEYGVRYGGRMSFIWLYLQIGILGVVFHITIIYKLFKFIWKNYKQNPLYLSFLSLTFVYAIDFFTYSNVFFRYSCLSGVYFFLGALIYVDIKKKGNYINKIFKN